MTTKVKKIGVLVNGELREFTPGSTIADLLAELGLHPRMIVVEHNREIVDRDQYGITQVGDGDALELVHFVGGG